MLVLSFEVLVQIIWSKINWLIGSIDLTPWYLTVLEGTAPTTPVRLCMLTLHGSATPRISEKLNCLSPVHNWSQQKPKVG